MAFCMNSSVYQREGLTIDQGACHYRYIINSTSNRHRAVYFYKTSMPFFLPKKTFLAVSWSLLISYLRCEIPKCWLKCYVGKESHIKVFRWAQSRSRLNVKNELFSWLKTKIYLIKNCVFYEIFVSIPLILC